MQNKEPHTSSQKKAFASLPIFCASNCTCTDLYDNCRHNTGRNYLYVDPYERHFRHCEQAYSIVSYNRNQAIIWTTVNKTTQK